MITSRFILKIRAYFYELGIEAKNGIVSDDFEVEFIKTLNRCKDLMDAKLAIKLYRYCIKKWRKIEKIFSKYLERWHRYCFDWKSNIETINYDEAQGTFYITNALTKNYNEVYLSSVSFDDELHKFKHKYDKYIFDNDSEYYIKFKKNDSCVMGLFDKFNNLLCDIVLSETFDVFLENNRTKYELVIQQEEDDNTFIGIFEKKYIDSLAAQDFIEFKNMVADIEWDLIDEKSDVGISKITLYKDINDISPLLYFAASTFLLYKSNLDYEKEQYKAEQEELAALMILQNNMKMIKR